MKRELFLTALLTLSCRNTERPKGIPDSALFVGTAEKYEYISCTGTSVAEYSCNIYSPSGLIMGIGRFSLVGQISFSPSQQSEYLGFNGHDILLAHGGRLAIHEPPRPAGVPSKAIWGGGPQCGAFFDCRSANTESTMSCTIYRDADGELITEGRYVFGGDGEKLLNEPKSCDAAKGGRIFLASGSYLERVD